MLLRTQLLYNLPLIIKDTSLLVSSGTSCLNLFQPIHVPLITKYVYQISWLGMEKTKPNTTKARIHQSKEMYYNTKKLKPGLVAFYDIQPKKPKEKISKGQDK